jgi:hypothetical protein
MVTNDSLSNVSGLGKEQIGKVLMQVFQYQSWFVNIWRFDKVTYSVSGSHLDQEGIIGGNKSGF